MLFHQYIMYTFSLPCYNWRRQTKSLSVKRISFPIWFQWSMRFLLAAVNSALTHWQLLWQEVTLQHWACALKLIILSRDWVVWFIWLTLCDLELQALTCWQLCWQVVMVQHWICALNPAIWSSHDQAIWMGGLIPLRSVMTYLTGWRWMRISLHLLSCFNRQVLSVCMFQDQKRVNAY